MAKEKVNPLGAVRRSIWYVLRAVLIVSVLLALAYAVFTEALYVSNMYIITTEGMELRADVILKNGAVSDLSQYFTEEFLQNDELLESRPYSDFLVDNFDYRYEIKGFRVFPWSKSGTITYEERIPTIVGSPVSDEITDPIPGWIPMVYKVELVKVEGRWLISGLEVVEENPPEEELPTPAAEATAQP